VSEAPSALAGLRVLDFSRVLAGPWATQILGDLGAEVIKIERPGSGDDTRAWGPPFLKAADGVETRESAYFLCANRNKKSVTLDFSHPEGAELARALAARSDVFVENFKLNGLAAHGLDFETLSARDPRLIYCSITGFGRTGPDAGRPGYDLLIQAVGGLMSVTGPAESVEGAGPNKAGVAVTDIMTGLYATIGILAALAHRTATGRGQRVDLSLLDTQVAALANQAMNYLVTGISPRRTGNAHPSIAPYQDLPTADGSMIVAIGNDSQFEGLCGAFGCPELALDPRFRENRARVENRIALIEILSNISKTRGAGFWLEKLAAVGAPSGSVNSIEQVFHDPQVVARGLRMDLPHDAAGTAPSVRNPIGLSRSPASYRRGPPLLGSDTDDVLKDVLGLDAERIDRLRASGVI